MLALFIHLLFMQNIILKDGRAIFIDDDELYNAYPWSLSESSNAIYLRTTVYGNGQKRTLYFHRVILNDYSKDKVVHFFDGNRLNFQKNNIALVSRSVKSHINNKNNYSKSSDCKGVTFRHERYIVRIAVNGKRKYLGRFSTRKEALDVYDYNAIQVFGLYAQLNSH